MADTIMVYLYRLEVEGETPFPLGALALQRCFPSQMEDLKTITTSLDPRAAIARRRVVLTIFSTRPIAAAAPVWEQAGWRVLDFLCQQVIEGKQIL